MPKLTPAMEKALRILNEHDGWHSAWGLDVSPNTLNALVRRGVIASKLRRVGIASKWEYRRCYRRKQDA